MLELMTPGKIGGKTRVIILGRLSKQAKEAMDAAREAVLADPKTRHKKAENGKKSQWIDDEWGDQGCVFFHENKYWGSKILPDGKVVSIAWTEEGWEKRKKEKQNGSGRGSLERRTNKGLVRSKQKSTRPSSKRGKLTRSEVGKQQSLSSRKSIGVVEGKGKGGTKKRVKPKPDGIRDQQKTIKKDKQVKQRQSTRIIKNK